VATADDHIAPWRAVYRLTQVVGGDIRFRLGHSGHIAGIINPPGPKVKGAWWEAAVNPPTPEEWRSVAHEHAGSWWPDWLKWIGQRSGEQRPTRPDLGSREFPPLGAAPGTYVFK